MKIVFFSSDNNASSGAFKAEINLINDLIKKGHDIKLVVPYIGTGRKFTKTNKINTKTIFSVFWICLYPKTLIDFLFYWLTWPINLIANMRTKKFLIKNKPDLVVMNTLWNGIGGEQAHKLNIPVVWHLREILEEGQHRTFYNKNKSIKIISKSKMLLAVSNSVLEKYKNIFNNKNIKVIYDGVNPDVYYFNNTRLFKDKTIHLLMVGRIFKEKGQYLAIKALNELSNYDFDITFVGFGYKSYINKIKRLGNKINDRLHFTGATNDVNYYYRKSDIFLMNSIGEAFGLVTAEAMLNGLVVVAAESDGTKEIIDNEDNGYFYKPNDYIDLKNKIKKIFLNIEQAKKKAKNGQNRILNNFSLKQNCDLIEKAYLEVLKK